MLSSRHTWSIPLRSDSDAIQSTENVLRVEVTPFGAFLTFSSFLSPNLQSFQRRERGVGGSRASVDRGGCQLLPWPCRHWVPCCVNSLEFSPYYLLGSPLSWAAAAHHTTALMAGWDPVACELLAARRVGPAPPPGCSVARWGACPVNGFEPSPQQFATQHRTGG